MFLTLVCIDAVNGLMAAKAAYDAFEEHVATMPEELRDGARKRHDAATRVAREERRHRELVGATRNRGPVAFLMGFIVGSA